MSGTEATHLTQVILIVVLLVLAVYDFIIYRVIGNPPTISRVIYGWASRYPWVIFVLGMIVGHLLIPQHIEVIKQ